MGSEPAHESRQTRAAALLRRTSHARTARALERHPGGKAMIADRLREVLPAEGISEREGDGRTLPVASPAERTEWVELMRLAASESWRIFTLGGGTHTASVPGEADLLLSTSRIDRVLAFEPGDGTLTAEAGATMGALGSLCEAGGYHLAPDVPSPERATLGGAIASGAAGIDRLRYGPTRAVLLGLEVLSSEGTITRSGGRLVKNVTGY
ncbi:MAG TPA: FAD-binding oxidoreductase, partial [Planctomycetes bacterium]|nr:FAD-binding oxidoreductase [Planctomycetota bacterium]